MTKPIENPFATGSTFACGALVDDDTVRSLQSHETPRVWRRTDGAVWRSSTSTGEIKRANNGFFGTNRERPAGKHQQVSCVVALRGWRPWQPDNPSILRFDKPFAAVSFPDELLPADHRLGVVRDERKLWLECTPTRPGTVF